MEWGFGWLQGQTGGGRAQSAQNCAKCLTDFGAVWRSSGNRATSIPALRTLTQHSSGHDKRSTFGVGTNCQKSDRGRSGGGHSGIVGVGLRQQACPKPT